MKTGVTLLDGTTHELKSVSDPLDKGIGELAFNTFGELPKLLPDRAGFRPLDPANVAKIKKDIEEHGFNPKFKILVDQDGRILSGRHRRAALESLGMNWTEYCETVVVSDDCEAIKLATMSNENLEWTSERAKELAELYQYHKWRQIRTMRRDNPYMAQRKIAAQVGVSPRTVSRALSEALEEDATLEPPPHPLAQVLREALEEDATLEPPPHPLAQVLREASLPPTYKPRTPEAAQIAKVIMADRKASVAQVAKELGKQEKTVKVIRTAIVRAEKRARKVKVKPMVEPQPVVVPVCDPEWIMVCKKCGKEESMHG
jgi:FixJ family two-component response regulator